jgi:DNA-directed RNA polymerase beta subunit
LDKVKANDGGLRLGEMENWVFTSHGTMRALHEKFYKDSDGFDIPICRVCGNRAVVNEKMGIYKCKACGDTADIANVSSSWTTNLFTQEASAMNVKMEFKLQPHQYTRMQD